MTCSINLLGNDNQRPFTGEVVNVDSVLISYDDLRIVNSKLIELKYQKEINNNLKSIIVNDSIIIKDYSNINNKINKDCKKAIRQRNICFGIAVVGTISSIILLIK